MNLSRLGISLPFLTPQRNKVTMTVMVMDKLKEGGTQTPKSVLIRQTREKRCEVRANEVGVSITFQMIKWNDFRKKLRLSDAFDVVEHEQLIEM
jgi:hypothetical protein